MSVCKLNGKASTSSCTHTHKLSALRSEFWLLFRTREKGITFYDVPVSYVKEELRFHCELEPFNAKNANSFFLKCGSTSRRRLQLTYRLCSYLDFMLKGEFYCLCCMCAGL